MGKNKEFKLATLAIFLMGFVLWLNLFHFEYYAYASSVETENTQEDGMERFLKADGKVLKKNYGKGDIVTLKGTNVGGWQVMESWMCPVDSVDQKTTITTLTERFGSEKAAELIDIYEKHWWQEQDFDNIVDLNFNVIRLPISYLNLLDDNGLLREDTLNTYDWFVDECAKRNLYVILDLHAAPGSQNGRDHSGDTSGSKLYSDEKYQDLTVSLWEQLAEHYKGNPTIAGYDLLNEPEGSESERSPWGSVHMPFYDRMYKAIRAIDPDHVIILEAIWEPTDMPDPSEYGWENVMYEYHYYGWDGIDDATKQRSFTNSKVQINNRANFDVPVLIGEFTLFDKLQSWEHALKVYDENGWSFTTWTYKTVEYGNWGIYTSKSSDTPKVNIKTDSFETITEKWSKVDTATSFSKNTYLYDLLRVMSDKDAGESDIRKWYRNPNSTVELKAGRQATAELVKGSTVTSDLGDSQVIFMNLEGADYSPTATSRNICISPSIRKSIDVTEMDYLIINTFVRQGKKPLTITLVDKDGNTWSNDTSTAATPIANQWEKLFLDLSKATIDKSAIIEIRIGAYASGKYYFNEIYFAQSYADPIPDETEEEMKKDLGQSGVIVDWDVTAMGDSSPLETTEGSADTNNKQNNGITLLVVSVISGILAVAAVIGVILKRKKK
jgi:aryl-phospho-beta-D-glucosidase BglC (GH1 family)